MDPGPLQATGFGVIVFVFEHPRGAATPLADERPT